MVLISGDEFLVDRELSRLWKGYQKAVADARKVELVAARDGAGGDFDEAVSPDLFGEVPLVILEGVEEADEGLQTRVLALAADPANETHVVLLVRGGVKGRGFVDKLRKSGMEQISVPTPAKREIVDFIAAEFKSHGKKKIEPDALVVLRDAVGDDLRSLAAAASQLASDLSEEVVTAEAVASYYEGMAGVAPYQVVDKAIAGDVTGALEALRWALERDPGIGPAVVASFTSALRELVAVIGAAAGAGEAEIARQGGMPPWKVKIRRQQSRDWPPRKLADAALLVTSAEAALKGGEIDALGRVEVLDPPQRQALLERVVVQVATLPARGR